MRKLCTTGLALFVTFAGLAGLLSSGEGALAAAEDNRATVEVCHGCEEDGGWFTSFHACNTEDSPAEYRIEYRQEGDLVASTTRQIEPFSCRSRMAGVEEGFEGTATIEASPGVGVIVGRSADPDGTGEGSAYAVPISPPISEIALQPRSEEPIYVGPEVEIDPDSGNPVGAAKYLNPFQFRLCNAGDSSTTAETSALLRDGGTADRVQEQELDSDECGDVDLTRGLTQAEVDKVVGGEIIADRIWYDPYDPVRFASDDVPDVVPGQSRDEAGEMVCVPPISYEADAFFLGAAILNVDSKSTSVFTRYYDPDGNVVDSGSQGLRSRASFQRTVDRDTGFCARSVNGSLSGQGVYIGSSDDASYMKPGAAAEETDYAFEAFRLPGDPVTKRALLAGAVRKERRTRVNVVMQNLTDRRTKARMIVRDGDGDRIFARTLRASGHATARRKFVPRARGDDLWVEVKVRGGNKEVFLWLERVDPSGDLTLYPAIEVR